MASSRLVARSRDIANVMQRLQGKRWTLVGALCYPFINGGSYLLFYRVRMVFLNSRSYSKLILCIFSSRYLKGSDYMGILV